MPTGRLTYDDELRELGAALRREWGVRQDDRVLDVGCGTGATTRDAAREASAGSATGVDLSADAIERARALARADGPGNVDFVCADAAMHVF
ncbi:class I SAM-dependent methyltransferase, partial [Cellulomonas sp.]|uniref:class I SAM-dependent methyltransferase n=1 Tax=Cellulomonas sp. TaxID=40001 RepID=UPI001B2A43CA